MYKISIWHNVQLIVSEKSSLVRPYDLARPRSWYIWPPITLWTIYPINKLFWFNQPPLRNIFFKIWPKKNYKIFLVCQNFENFGGSVVPWPDLKMSIKKIFTISPTSIRNLNFSFSQTYSVGFHWSKKFPRGTLILTMFLINCGELVGSIKKNC